MAFSMMHIHSISLSALELLAGLRSPRPTRASRRAPSIPSACIEAPRLPSTARAYGQIHSLMRLLYTTGEGRLEWTDDLIGDKIPSYAILSHTWGGQEATFKDLRHYSSMEEVDAKVKEGYQKIFFCAQQAKRDGLDYFWVDTCCIDKTNSQELQEAINSMFRWYQNAKKCYVYLPDVECNTPDADSELSRRWKPAFRKSKWFTRGWTLQELLAPASVAFYSKEGDLLGDKQSLRDTIHEITGIPIEALSGKEVSNFSVAERFSWAHNRQTTRPEDGAYCLLGIFGIHLPLIYSEGKENALKRLEKEIRESFDQVASIPVDNTDARSRNQEERLGKIFSWLSAPDPSTNYHKAHKQRQAKTGLWLLESTKFTDWKKRAASRLWLYGIPGCGKTILSSTVVENLLQYCHDDTNMVTAYFYFNFNDAQKQDPELMLRSLLCQLVQRSVVIPKGVDALFSSCENGQRKPSSHVLLQVIKEAAQEFTHVYVVLDALDECAQRSELMGMLEAVAEWQLDNLHLLMTSRKERDIERSLEEYIREEDTTLDQTYDRILTAISEEYAEYAMRILQWLTFSARPLSVEEVAEVVAIDVARDPAFDRDEVLEDPLEVLDICSSLVTITTNEVDRRSGSAQRIVALAHYSVQEYLVSDRIRQGDEGEQASQLAASLMAKEEPAYLTWIRLHDPDRPWERPNSKKSLDSVPMPLYYAALLGFSTVTRLLLDKGANVNAQGGRHGNALQAASLEGHEQIVKMLLDAGANVNAEGGDYSNALQAASWRGHEQVVKTLLDAGANVNAEGGEYGNALQAASEGGHEQVFKMLLDAGAEVNTQGGRYGNALQAASLEGHEQVVKTLLDAGADINAQGGEYGNALQAASYGGHEQIVKTLLDAGADVNAQGGDYSNALQAASEGGYEQVVKMLLNAGADVNAQGGEYGNALQAASYRGHEQVIKMLLNAGADVNAQGGRYSNALQAASEGGHEQVVKMLLDAGTNVNAQGGYFGNALQTASLEGHEQIVKMLLNAGAEVNAEGGRRGNALQAASYRGHQQIVKTLLNAGADVNAQGGEDGNALQTASVFGHEQIAASVFGHEQVVKTLLNAGADVNAQGGEYGNALQAALEEGHEQVAKTLLEAGAH
ncbi:vegetative incompatibility protein HET-E-1 [Stemphylium lycopersici]|nr:vegetative incompatibility protein HET-E-1 [Stemphylium lycopersici]